MNMPNSYNETSAGGFTPVELGGHYAVIKNVSERETKNGDPMVVVSIDFDKKDAQAGYFTEQFKNDIRPDKKYPNQAVNYITTEYNGKCTKSFKAFMTSYANSNGIKEEAIKWGNDFTSQFKNKKIGVVFGNVEEEYNGEIKMRRKIRWFCDYNKVADQKTPEDKLLSTKASGTSSKTGNSEEFVPTPDDMDEIPFE